MNPVTPEEVLEALCWLKFELDKQAEERNRLMRAARAAAVAEEEARAARQAWLRSRTYDRRYWT